MIERCRTTETYFYYKYLNVRCAYLETASYLSSFHLIRPLLSYSQLQTAISQSSNDMVQIYVHFTQTGLGPTSFSAGGKRRRFLCLSNTLWWGSWYLHRQKQQSELKSLKRRGFGQDWAKKWLDPTHSFWQVVCVCSRLRETTAGLHIWKVIFRKQKTAKHTSALEKLPSLPFSEHQKKMLD